MGRFSTPCLVALVLLAAFFASGGAQSAPESLKRVIPDMTFMPGNVLGNSTTVATCPPSQTGPTSQPASAPLAIEYKTAAPPTPGQYRLADAPPRVTIAFTGASAPTGPLPPSAPVTSGMTVTAELKFGATSVARGGANVTAGANPQPATITLVPIATANASSGPIAVLVTFTPTQAAANNIALACGTSKVETFNIALGVVGDGDLDRDNIPDSEDADMDGDGVSNVQERAVVCTVNGRAVDFSRTAPSGGGNPTDHDGDGVSDVVECQKGSDPLSKLSVPPGPTPFPWDLLIFGIILLILVAALVFFFTVYGKAAAVHVVSSPELIIPAGASGKFQLTLQNLRKKGAPITFQLSASGMPEGWDARLQPGSAVLDPVGGAKNVETVWLTVEAPTHQDPESAVVVVRAIALNAQGRKDTLKLPASAKTITSINVPANAKVPIHRGQAVKLRKDGGGPGEAPTGAPAEAGGEAPLSAAASIWLEKDRPVIDIEGVGETYAPKLDALGAGTVQRLHGATASKVASDLGTSETTVRQWQEMAELIDVHGVGPQIAELLVRSGVHSIAQLAKADPKELAATIERTNADRKVKIQGGPAGLKSVKGWIKSAGKHPLGDRPVPEAPATPAAPEPAEPTSEAPPPQPAAAAAKPNLQVGGLVHAPATFSAGQDVKSTVTVTNAGAAPQTLKLSLFVNDALADAQTVTVKPGKSKEVKFKWTAQEKNKLNIRGELVAG